MPSNISALTPDDALGFAQVLAIYHEAIEPSEQKTPETLHAALADPRYAFLALRTAGNIDAFAILFFPDKQDFWLLEYAAVDSRLRSQGTGEKIFGAAVAFAIERAPGCAGVLEVDQVRDAANDTRRRLKFYRRMGCRAISGIEYILPLETSGTPPPMMLLVHGLDNETTVSRQWVRECLIVIYREVYHRPSDDPRIDMMMSGLPDILPLTHLPAGETSRAPLPKL